MQEHLAENIIKTGKLRLHLRVITPNNEGLPEAFNAASVLTIECIDSAATDILKDTVADMRQQLKEVLMQELRDPCPDCGGPQQDSPDGPWCPKCQEGSYEP
jgi:hypothetical protein